MMGQASAAGDVYKSPSVHNVIPWGGYAHYCATKAGLDMLTKTVALELATENVRVNSVAPGAIGTPTDRRISLRAEGGAVDGAGQGGRRNRQYLFGA